MPVDEIKRSISKETCGVFNSCQLKGQQRMKSSRRLLFYCLATLSILGFSVRPLSAQTTIAQKDTVLVGAKPTKQDSIKTEPSKVKKANVKTDRSGLFRRKKNHTVTGCPMF